MTAVQHVEPTKSRAIPPRFDVRHAVAFFFHDELVRLVAGIEEVGAVAVQLHLEPDEYDEIALLSGEDLWEWLASTGRTDVIDDLTYRQMTAAVVADAANFISESLLASAKGKTAVAYSLLRKPLKENLLLLEWLLADPEDFLQRFQGESTYAYTLNRLPIERRRSILNRAARAVDLPILDGESMWLIRYAKEYPNSLETLWTKATHLVTSFQASATEPGNLNFVFSSESAVEEQWRHYYRLVPLLLYYFVKVAEGVAFRFVDRNERLFRMKCFLRDLAFMRYAEAEPDESLGRTEDDEFWLTLAELSFECERCGKEVAIRDENRDRVWVAAELKCDGCNHVYSFWRDIIDRETDANGT